MSVRKITLISAAGLALSAVPPLLYSAWLGGPTLRLAVIAAVSLSGAALAWGAVRLRGRALPPASSGRSERPAVESCAREAATNEVLDSLPDPVIEVDGSGRVVFVNRAALLAMERNAEEASAKCAEFLSAAASSLPGKGGQDAFEAPLPMKDGSTRFFEFKPMRLGNNAVFIGRDSDERKRLLDELTSAREQEAEASAKLRRTISDLEEFALLAIRRELKMQELRERFVRLKEEHEINKEFPG